jgi:type II secretory pathway pseudopilin PulG
MLQRHGNKSVEQSEDESGSGDEYDDDGEEERVKQATQQRRKQEANMSVYRQQMKKVTGGGPSDLPSARPGMERAAQSASGFYLGGMNGAPPADAVRGKQSDEDDDEVPLGILQAHGFPSGSRPPMQLGGEYSQRASVAGSVVGGGGQGNLPAFARRLPQDPYFGAGLVNSTNRESLAFGGGGGSVYGGPASPMGHPMGTPGGHPGGLVGVIAGEERAKAARRATPSAAFGAPLPSNMPRTMSMGNLPPPSMYGGQGMPPMPQMPQMPQMMPGQDSNQQMQQFMQMQMQFMQNMMAMQQQNMGQAPPMQMPQPGANGFLSPAPSRPMSMASQAPPNQRSMTMMGPPPTWGQQAPQQNNRPGSSFQHYAPSVQNLQAGPGAGYTPSIAPSERSNIGMPSRYRPVSTMNGDGGSNSAMMSGGRSQSMTSSMTLQAFTNPAQQSEEQAKNGTIRVIDKPKGAPRIVARAVEPEEDEDQGWNEMAKKRSERKWKWGRSKKEQAPKEEGLGELYQNVD